jgi:hypothetical protein
MGGELICPHHDQATIMAVHFLHNACTRHAVLTLTLTLTLLSICTWSAASESRWPQVALPEGVRAFEIAAQASVNGLPMQLRGFVSDSAPDQLLTWFRRRLGQPLVENVIGNKRLLGRAQGAYYITLQLESAGQGTRGLIAVTALAGALAQRAVTEVETARLLSGFPPGSRLLNRIVSSDAGKVSTYVVLTNAQDQELNVQRIKEMMRADGLTLERRIDSGAQASTSTVFFKGRNREAVAIVYRDGAGQSAIVMNQVHLIDAPR